MQSLTIAVLLLSSTFLLAHPIPDGARDAPFNAKNDEREPPSKIVDAVDLNKADKGRGPLAASDKSEGQGRNKREAEGAKEEAEGSRPSGDQFEVPEPAVEFPNLPQLNNEQFGARDANEPNPQISDPVSTKLTKSHA